ncbi:hydantoinase B/oxoprolinase family protein [Micromonospora sp. LOL_023]|uniref:hydantoinase B/oxoprolinase family protein n=1 Tax=Micromonospora sp. LOL_023 TaxID=3345418 RepID=UPI003A8B6F14
MTTVSSTGPAGHSTAGRDVDPVTFEVIRHRLLAITDEQGAVLSAISGSPHVTEASDYNVGLYLPDGSVAAMGRTILLHSASMAAITRHVIADCGDDPGIAAGDMFIVNDPWKGAVHAPDLGIVAPIFYEGELLAWSGAMCHMVDVGAMQPGGFCSAATESFQEGLQLPPTKLIDGGRTRTDVWNIVLAHTRMASTANLDLRGLVAANHTAVRAMTELADRYGAATVRKVMSGLIELSETRLRNRLRELPDATVRSRAYLDNDGGLAASEVDAVYDVDLVLTKQGDQLHFDYSGSSPQATGYINCTRSGLMAGVAAALLPTLAFDSPWNEGLFHPVEVHAPEGLIINARRPAPVSGGVLEAAWLVEMTAVECLSRLAACSDDLIGEAQAAPAGGPDQFVLTGTNSHGEHFTHVILDCLATGGGAYAHRDGVWTQGQHNIERQRIANAETVELDMPLLYLWRGLVTDSGGAGRHRGGQSIGAHYAVHGSDDVSAVCSGHGWLAPNSTGLFGGYPSGPNGRRLVRDSDLPERLAGGEIPDPETLTGDRPPMRGRAGKFRLGAASTLSYTHQAGGGWGDPLERPIEALRVDLRQRAVSPEAAVRLYGAVLDADGELDAAATADHRSRLRAERRAWPAAEALPAQPAADGRRRLGPIGDRLERIEVDGARYVACHCGTVLAPLGQSWRRRAACLVSTDVHQFSPATRLAEELEIRQYACPGCGLLHATDVSRRDADLATDMTFADRAPASAVVR